MGRVSGDRGGGVSGWVGGFGVIIKVSFNDEKIHPLPLFVSGVFPLLARKRV